MGGIVTTSLCQMLPDPYANIGLAAGVTMVGGGALLILFARR